MPNYGDPNYWIQRYTEQEGTTFDWLEDYDTIKPILEEIGISKNSRILNVGCGNSEFSEKMYEDGYVHKGLHFDVMDVKEMKFKDETFDCVIDKSTIDALLCGEHSFMNVALMTKEISRVLKTGGIYFIISYGSPDNRMMHLERDHLAFDIQIYTIKKQDDDENGEKVHYGYICKKLENANENLNNFDLVYKELEQEELEEENQEDEEGEDAEDIKDEGDDNAL